MPPTPPSNYVCDTIPAARLATSSDQQLGPDEHAQTPTMDFEPAAVLDDAVSFAASPKSDPEPEGETFSPPPQQPPPRKLCVRHQRMADEGTNLKLQQALDALPLEEREAVSAVWSNFSSSSHPRRALILQGLLTMCCFSQLSLLTEQLAHLIRIDPFAVLPKEVCFKILGYLDATSLCRAAQVTKRWKALADDNILWRGICEQHIGQKCHKCGWGLPVLEKKRMYRPRSRSPPLCPASTSAAPTPPPSATLAPSRKRSAEESSHLLSPPLKRQRSEPDALSNGQVPSSSLSDTSSSCTLVVPDPALSIPPSVTRPWKDVYSERMTVERNWRRGRCTVRTLAGHTDGVMCLQFSETLSHPAFPVLITGSYDRTVRVWNLETGAELHCLKGHTRAVRALQFDEVKLITGSMDNTLKVWDWRRGKCIKTLNGHTEGVVCLNFDSNILASGSVDSTIKVWNLRTGGAFTLRGHSDWVNAVQIWDSNAGARSSSSSGDASIFDVSGSTSPINNATPNLQATAAASSQIDPGKMLFSASDDGTIKLWDLNLRTCVRQFTGHVGQVQSMKLLMVGECDDEDPSEEEEEEDVKQEVCPRTGTAKNAPVQKNQNLLVPKRTKPVLISGSLDNTIKLWDIETGKATRTYFGHIEGVWGVACDKLRLVSASHDRTIKVWSREEGSCTSTLVGHQAAVSCIALGEDKIISGSDDWTVKVWSFSG